ncbi:kinase-like domain-containing protein [Armillaria luteobubalina]|uniref:Kinase-like domain-containing protein n=1 Tax=Armillaria luteobubalina TaxID=153913 RepID=A0AA39V593_9AGAR|nr:kinase-like domain-containing protein [Armillaria luteobubalina]
MFAPSPSTQNAVATHYVSLPTNHQRAQQQQQQAPKSPINVVGIPSVHIQNNKLVVGSSQSSSTRSYTPLKVLGDGSFGTVWLCDWHGTLPPNTPLSPMQCGAGARAEWVGKRLVAVKRMKRRWEGGWDECRKLKELESLRAIPFHPNIIPLYDFFLLPATKELYFIFESMEGNLYHLIKARKGRALAGGLVSSIFRQIVSGLHHIHASGYFHRDMKPENVLVTTTGLFDYTSLSPVAPPNAPPEKDVVAIIKLADFGLARETKSKPPYTEYVSTRWYRAPEVLLLSRDYSNPVDMWALGTIMAELVNLRPLFPGQDQVDQVARICEILGDPSDEYGLDSSHSPMGGGVWPKGIKMAKDVGFKFPKTVPKDIHTLFERTVPLSLIHCIRDLLRYDPDTRLTSGQCLYHRYLQETTPRNNIPLPPGISVCPSIPTDPVQRNGVSPSPSRTAPASHPYSTPHLQPIPPIPTASTSHRTPLYAHAALSNSSSNTDVHMHHTPSPHSSGLIQEETRSHISTSWAPSSSVDKDYPMDVTPSAEITDDPMSNGQPMDISGSSPVVPEFPTNGATQPGHKPKPFGLGFGRKHTKWSLFGGDKHHALPPLHENPPAQLGASTSTPSLKRQQSSSSDGRSLRESSPTRDNARIADVKKMNKKEAERLQREAEKQRRALAEKMQRDQARAVMQKRNQIVQKTTGKDDIEWLAGSQQRLDFEEKGKQAATGPIRQVTIHGNGTTPSITVNAASGRFATQVVEQPVASGSGDWRNRVENERLTKIRRRDLDDDHSISSSDVHSGRNSSISYTTVDSDPGPSSRMRNRPSIFGINRMTSTSSLRTSFDDFASSARSSNSFSLDGQLANDFRARATVNTDTPPPMQISLSPSLSPSLPPSPAWMQVAPHGEDLSSRRGQAPPFISMPRPTHPIQNKPFNPYEYSGQLHGHSPSPGHLNKSEINPIFQVVSYKWDEGGLEPDDIVSGDFVQPPILPPPHPPPLDGSMDDRLSSSSPTSLPPFSELDAVAGAGYDYPPLSPMSFTTPSEDGG